MVVLGGSQVQQQFEALLMSPLPAGDAIVCWRDGLKSIFLQLFLQKWINERYLEPRKENGQNQVNSLYQDGQTRT